MQQRTSLCVAALFILSSFALAQQPTEPPHLPASFVGPQLVAWSDLQKPQPMPQPLPPPERADQSRFERAQVEQAQELPSAQVHQSIQAFLGTIAKDGQRYILKTSDNAAYQIDNLIQAQGYDGKQVRISGCLDPINNILHILSIEAVS